LQKLRPAIIALLLGACVLPALASSVSAQTCTCAGAGIRSDVAPPALPDYDQPPIPASGYMWTPGYWAWNNADYYWVPGTWVEPPQPGLLWTPGYWGFVDGVYAFNGGYWGLHVGFYGGVSYGFGYGGVGYEGGHWDHGAFFYNRTVNNIGSVHIDNVYEKPVTINAAGAGRASFNGPGGSLAKPTAEEEAAAKEPHVPPTDRQVEHTRAASMKSSLFMSTNHGKPAIAATGKPGAFTGASVVKAKAAGAEPGQPTTEEKKGPEKGELKPETKATPTVEEKVEKKTPERSNLKPVVKSTPAVAPASAVKPSLGEPVNKPSPKPTVEKQVKRPPPPVEKQVKPSPKPMVEKQVKRPPPPAPHTPSKPKCGKPGQPKC